MNYDEQQAVRYGCCLAEYVLIRAENPRLTSIKLTLRLVLTQISKSRDLPTWYGILYCVESYRSIGSSENSGMEFSFRIAVAFLEAQGIKVNNRKQAAFQKFWQYVLSLVAPGDEFGEQYLMLQDELLVNAPETWLHGNGDISDYAENSMIVMSFLRKLFSSEVEVEHGNGGSTGSESSQSQSMSTGSAAAIDLTNDDDKMAIDLTVPSTAAYTSVGIVPLLYNQGCIWMLVALDPSSGEAGGIEIKMINQDCSTSAPVTTIATNALVHQTYSVIDHTTAQRMIQQALGFIECFVTNSVTYFAAALDSHRELDRTYNTWHKTTAAFAQVDEAASRPAALHWLKVEDVVQSARNAPNQEFLFIRGTELSPRSSYRISPRLKVLLNDPATDSLLRLYLTARVRLDLLSTIEAELLSVNNLQTGNPLDPSAWKLRLRLPPSQLVNDTSSIVTLPHTDPEYKTVFGYVPAQYQNQIKSIRKVTVAVRQAEHEAMEFNLRKTGKVTAIIEPTFHGTAQRWRATNISFKGFDLSIKRNGRALGNGVYSCVDINTPLGYTVDRMTGKMTGSVLVLRGTLTADDANNKPVYVFRETAQALPLYLIDFGGAQCDIMAETAAEKRHRLLSAEIQALEATFTTTYQDQHRRYGEYFASALTDYRRLLQQQAGNAADIVLTIGGKLELDRRVFRSGNIPPIYACKNELITRLQQCDLMVISAATGSGKSTQIPQIILDDIFVQETTRRIAVLQPRRFNATSLCQRVSNERNVAVGTEIGYTLCMGESCTSSRTRIEFMTYEHFITIAKDTTKLMNEYCAVVMDEAHERNIYVELTFALSKRALLHIDTLRKEGNFDAALPFKAVVCSASLDDSHLRKFEEYFVSSGSYLSSCFWPITVSSYPVLIMHRGEAEPDWNEANSLELTTALATYATEIAIELIKTTESDGNVLVFMPSDHVVMRNMLSVSTWASLQSGAGNTASGQQGEQGQDQQQRLTMDFEFKLNVKGELGKEKEIVVGVYPFSEAIDEATKQKMMSHRDQDRIIIFSTNAAETGLTLPNIRYVIDTGLERRVCWNEETQTQEMRTVQITKSSMKQRAGRAGRVASGICVRLYSKETEDSLLDMPPAIIESGLMLRTVLFLCSMEQVPKMLYPLPSDRVQSAVKTLCSYHAINARNAATSLGQKLLQLGINLRLGRFLLVCAEQHCLKTAVDIVAILSVANCLTLLPKHAQVDSFLASNLLDTNGDHFSLLKIFREFRERSIERHRFCDVYRLDRMVLDEADRICEYLDQLLWDGMKMIPEDDHMSSEDMVARVKAALCASHLDQIMTATTAATNNTTAVFDADNDCYLLQEDDLSAIASGQKPSRVFVSQEMMSNEINEHDADMMLEDSSEFVGGMDDVSMIHKVNRDSLVVRTHQHSSLWSNAAKSTDRAGSAPLSSASAAAVETIDLTGTSSVPQIAKTRSSRSSGIGQTIFGSFFPPSSSSSPQAAFAPQALDSNAFSFAMFSKLAISDTGKHIAQVVTLVNAQDIQRGLQLIAKMKEDDVISILENDGNNHVNKSLPISEALRTFLLHNNAAELQKLTAHYVHATYANVSTLYDGTHQLDVTASAHAMQYIEKKMSKMEEKLKPQTIRSDFKSFSPADADKVLTFFGGPNTFTDRKEQFIKRLNAMLKDVMGGHSYGNDPIHRSDIWADSTRHEIVVSFSDFTKDFTGLIMGAVQSAVAEQIGTRQFSLNQGNKGGAGGSANGQSIGFTLSILSNPTPPVPIVTDKKSVMVFMAHAAVWREGCTIYGGFVRDLVIREDEDANDIDIAYSRTTIEALRTLLTKLAKECSVTITNNAAKTGATSFKISNVASRWDFDIDLTDIATMKGKANAPGVDSDVGNMIIEAPSMPMEPILKLKVNKPCLVPLEQAIIHCHAKKFVFYYSPTNNQQAQIRLERYLARGWTCVSELDGNLLNYAKTAGYGALLQPMPDFSRPFHTY